MESKKTLVNQPYVAYIQENDKKDPKKIKDFLVSVVINTDGKLKRPVFKNEKGTGFDCKLIIKQQKPETPGENYWQAVDKKIKYEDLPKKGSKLKVEFEPYTGDIGAEDLPIIIIVITEI